MYEWRGRTAQEKGKRKRRERRRCEELTSSSGQTTKENEELRMVLEKTERERDELKRDLCGFRGPGDGHGKQNEYGGVREV